MNNRKRHKFLSLALLVIFSGVALYLCPCATAAPVTELSITKTMNHDCCDGMKNCPIQNCGAGGLNNLIPSFNSEKPAFDLRTKSLDEVFHSNSDSRLDSLSFLRTDHSLHEADPQILSSPKLFIQFASLLI